MKLSIGLLFCMHMWYVCGGEGIYLFQECMCVFSEGLRLTLDIFFKLFILFFEAGSLKKARALQIQVFYLASLSGNLYPAC